MLTRQGWTAGWGAMALFGTGRLLGIGQLYVFGAAALLLVIGALAYVHLVRIHLEVDRQVHPARLYAGSTSRVRIRIGNLRRRRTPLLRIDDPVSDTHGAHMVLAPLDAGAAETCSYRLPTERRGIVHVGPLRIVIGDPFGLTRSAVTAAPQVQVTVFPRVDPVQPVPFTAGHDPLAGVRQPNALGRSGDDFYALRPYVMGDDLRRIHWPSTARHDELLVRQHEQPWQGRTTVLLDMDSATYDPASFEEAVSAAASIVSANSQRRDLVRLVTSDGTDTGFGVGRTHLEAMLERLAVAEAMPVSNVRAMLELLQRGPGSGGSLVTIIGQATEDTLAALQQASRRLGSLSIVVVEPSGHLPAEPHRAFTATASVDALPAVRVSADLGFQGAWNQALRSRRDARSTIAGRSA
jgi:uncharacterized protein (DUF58 family)